jgi:hypothetical protein
VKAAKRQRSDRINNSDAQTNALEIWSILKDDGDMINPAGRNKLEQYGLLLPRHIQKRILRRIRLT